MTSRVPQFAGSRHSARSLALQVLLDLEHGDGYIQEVLDRHLSQAVLGPADRRLATQLAYGILRRRTTLDALLAPLVTRQRHEVEPWLWEMLRLGAFQIALLTQIPPHAALYETVELARVFQRPRAKGFLNAVLRALQHLVTEERTNAPGSDALPLESREYRRLSRPVLPDPATHPVEYLAAGFALPRWLVRRWLDRGGWEEGLRLGFWFAAPPAIWLRCNPLRTDRTAMLAALAKTGVSAEPGEHPQAVRLTEPAVIRDLPGYAEGWFTVQDEAAMRVASALAPEPGSRVLDLCAAPGGKTTHLAELMHNQGQVIACDVDDRRLQTVVELARRLGLDCIETRRLHPEHGEAPPAGPFDAILVDVPCSNTGVLGRRPEVRWRLRLEDILHLVEVQKRLLHQAVRRLKPGGRLVYSTCSIEPEENRQLVDFIVQSLPSQAREAESELAPGRPADGGYWALLRKTKPGW
jgi:16S rRNA (cytosine967-C5)-methyltransferase